MRGLKQLRCTRVISAGHAFVQNLPQVPDEKPRTSRDIAQFTCSTYHTVGMKRNLTIQLDADLIRQAKVIAAERGTSVSGLVTQQITELIEARGRYISARKSALEMMSAATDHGGRSGTREQLYGHRLDWYGA